MNQLNRVARVSGLLRMELEKLESIIHKESLNMILSDISDELPKGIYGKYRKRELTKIEQIIVHHTADFKEIIDIAGYHTSPKKYVTKKGKRVNVGGRGWPGIGYHFVIDLNGNLFMTNPLETISFHVRNQNTKSVGVCLIGNYNDVAVNDLQAAALRLVIQSIRNLIGAVPVKGHRDVGATECPGDNLYKIIQTL